MPTKMTAPMSCGPTREMALLMAEARPALAIGTERMRAVVSGATSIVMPMPNRRTLGSRSMR